MPGTSPILIVDLEATCADDGSIPSEEMEIIEVGAAWATADGHVLDTFQCFVLPMMRPQLTGFCTELTKIAQGDVDGAEAWATTAPHLADFARRYEGSCWASWGAYDRLQVARECARHAVANPLAQLPHTNLKAAFAKARRIKQVGMTTALKIVGKSLEGPHHRALSDALNVARVLPFCGPLSPIH